MNGARPDQGLSRPGATHCIGFQPQTQKGVTLRLGEKAISIEKTSSTMKADLYKRFCVRYAYSLEAYLSFMLELK